MFTKTRIVKASERSVSCGACDDFQSDQYLLELKIIVGRSSETKWLCQHCVIELAAILEGYRKPFKEIFETQEPEFPMHKVKRKCKEVA